MKLLITLCFLAFTSLRVIYAYDESQKFSLGEENLAPWATDFLEFAPGPANGVASDRKFPLVLAEKRTNRPDILRGFKRYHGGWDITNRHYWASVGFTGAAGFILASIWFFSFALALAVHHCCRWGIHIKDKDSYRSRRICLALLLVFTCAAA